MIPYTLEEISGIVGGKLEGTPSPENPVTEVVIDSRVAGRGCLFAALPGTRTDGHAYVSTALAAGAAGALVQHVPQGVTGPVIVVPDVEKALWTLASSYRERFSIPVYGITGSVGKTTTKEMIAAVLGMRWNVLKTEKNLNNDLGVPLTLFRLAPEHEAAVIEMGISNFGEMTQLAAMVQPTDAVFTVIGTAHLAQLKDRQGVLRAKTEMLSLIPPDGTVFINGDDDLLRSFPYRTRHISYGLGPENDLCALDIVYSSDATSCLFRGLGKEFPVRIPSYGKHMIYAALAAAAIGLAAGLAPDEICGGLLRYESVGRRASVWTAGGITLVDDCYNANPESLRAAIDSLAVLPCRRRVCILGDMLELGENRESLHYDCGRYAAEHKVELLLTAGEESRCMAQGAQDAGAKALHYGNKEELTADLPNRLKEGDAVLVKASHSMAFESISEAIKEQFAKDTAEEPDS
jgi:UDP-N-acetylmuramoyl-tripeptide--D-alanyl-D-alanine ligase